MLTDFSDLDRIAAQWEGLWENDPRATIFGSLAWARAAWRTYGSRRSLRVSVVWAGDNVVAILPLAIEDGTLRFLAEPRSDYNDILLDPSAGPEVLETAFSFVGDTTAGWRHCVLANVSEESNLIACLPQIARGTGLLFHLARTASCPCVDLAHDADRTLAGILKKKSLKRHENSLRRLGNLEFRHIVSREEAREHFPDFFRQHVARRALAGDRSLFHDSASRTFYECLVNELDPNRELRFSVVEIDGRPVAYHFGFEAKGVLTWYKPTFDVDYWDYSPGEVLIKKLFEYAKESESRKFDFTVGDESFKARFANRVAGNFTLRVYRDGCTGVASRFVAQAREGFKRRPVLFRAASNALSLGKNAYRESCRVLRRHGLIRAAAKLCGIAWRGAFFRRDEVLVFAIRAAELEPSNTDVELQEGTLSALACLAEFHGDYLTTRKLAQAQQRLRKRDKLFLGWKGGELAHIAWIGVRSEITASFEVGENCRIKLEESSPVIYDCWTPPKMRGRGIYPRVLRGLIGEYHSTASECWIYCLRSNLSSLRGIEKAGLRLRYRMRRVRWFRYIEFARVSAARPRNGAEPF